MNPYILPKDEWCLVSFSGGRSSAYMLYQMVKENNGLPDKTIVAFANTGREMPQTLDFVHECEKRWGIDIVWLEYNHNGNLPTFEKVTHDTASRNGEPFEKLIDTKNFLPNVAMRFCTQELKIKTIQRYMRIEHGTKEYLNYIGIRADEPRRISKIRTHNETENLRPNVIPLHESGATKEIVLNFWKEQPFDLQLRNVNGTTPLGNCDLCFLKGVKRLSSLIRDHPERAEWWIKQEEKLTIKGCEKGDKKKATFIKFIPYKELPGWANESLFDNAIECIGCTD